tara:strand:+ start:13857 stop:14654 length:798 start_codon:yes stop_codon:yes gene_type:complete
MIKDLQKVFRMFNFKNFSVTRKYCPACDRSRIFLRLNANAISIRCLTCRSSVITLALIDVLRDVMPGFEEKSMYELSSRGPFVKFLKDSGVALSCSEYFEDIEPGKLKNGVQCQDVQRLTYDDKIFDVCTSSEVFEHVPNDKQGFSEVCRVLRKDGVFVFTVPLDLKSNTLERALLNSKGDIEHLHEPEYHIDPIREHEPILAFRSYGVDILERLTEAGFERAEVRLPVHELPWSEPRPIIVAYKSIANRQFSEMDSKVFRSVLV